MLPTERTSFGFKDGISNPAIEGSGIPATNPREDPFKAGEFVLGYPDENGDLPPRPSPRRSAATAATSSSASSTPGWRRSASTSVPAPRVEPRRSCSRPSSSAAGRAARRWRSLRTATTRSSGPIPSETTPSSTPRTTTLAASSARSAPTPAAATHATRRSPAWRGCTGSSGGAPATARSLPEGVLEDDGADRGILFFCLQANLDRGFEFVKTQWINEGTFIGAPAEMDPLVGAERRDPAGSPSPSSRSADASRSCPSSSSTAAASTSSCPACGRCAGSPSSTPEPADPKHRHPQPRDGRPTCRPAGPCRPRVRHHGRLHVPSPERPGRLVLVMNVFPIAAPTALFSDALSCRFRLRPVTAIAAAGTPFAAGPTSGRSTSD